MPKTKFKEVKLNPECDSLKPLCNTFPGTDAKVLKIHLSLSFSLPKPVIPVILDLLMDGIILTPSLRRSKISLDY